MSGIGPVGGRRTGAFIPLCRRTLPRYARTSPEPMTRAAPAPHTEDTGQALRPEAPARIRIQSQSRPWRRPARRVRLEDPSRR